MEARSDGMDRAVLMKKRKENSMLLSASIGYHIVHIIYIHNKATSVVLSANEDDCIPFYFWYLENLKQWADIESAGKYERMQKEKNIYARRLTRDEFDRLITDWERILETGYRCKNPNLFPMHRFDKPVEITSSNEQARIKAELDDIQKLAERANWDEDEIVLVIAADMSDAVRQIIV